MARRFDRLSSGFDTLPLQHNLILPLPLEVLTCPSKLCKALTKRLPKLGQLTRAEDNQRNHQYQQNLWHSQASHVFSSFVGQLSGGQASSGLTIDVGVLQQVQ